MLGLAGFQLNGRQQISPKSGWKTDQVLNMRTRMQFEPKIPRI